jgi:hypothetical protein
MTGTGSPVGAGGRGGDDGGRRSSNKVYALSIRFSITESYSDEY